MSTVSERETDGTTRGTHAERADGRNGTNAHLEAVIRRQIREALERSTVMLETYGRVADNASHAYAQAEFARLARRARSSNRSLRELQALLDVTVRQSRALRSAIDEWLAPRDAEEEHEWWFEEY